MAEPNREAEEAQQDCFLCVLDSQPCSQKRLEGSIRAVAQRKIDGEWTPFITLNTGTALISLQLTRYYLSLVQELKRLEQQTADKRLRDYKLTLRVYHLPPVIGTSEFNGWPVHHYQAGQFTLAVLEPDILLNITDLSQSDYCARQYLLKQLVPSSPSAAATSGNLVHHSFKELLKEHDRGALMTGHAAGGEETPLATMQRHFEQELERSSLDLALADLSPTAIRERVEPHLSSLANWFAEQRSTLWDMPDYSSEAGDGESSARENMVRAETFLLAPEIGLRGRLDLLWQQSSRQRLLELKTGAFSGDSPKHEHRWQVYGYHALLAVRRDPRMKKARATLLYSATPGSATTFPVPFSIINLQRVNEARNLLVLGHITGIAPAPPGPSRCTRCSLLPQCEQVSSLLGWQPPQPDITANGNGAILSETAKTTAVQVAALTPEDRAFFEKFYHLLHIEGLEGEKHQALLWQETLAERVSRGAAIQHLVPAGEPEPTGQGEWWQTFYCENTSELRTGDEVLLSDGNPVTGEVVTGTVVAISAEKITVWTPELIAHPKRIDSYDTDRVHVRMLKNILRWLQIDSRLRSLVAGQLHPAFRQIPVPARDDFNHEQNLAVERAMQMQDYLLVHGPPGTGKTAVIAEIVKRLHGQGQRILLAAFTNQAVDNMLKRLDKEGFHDYVRLGHERNVDPEIQQRLLKKLAQGQWLAGSTNDKVSFTSAENAESDQQEHTHPAHSLLRQMSVVASTTATWSSDTYDFLFPAGNQPWQFDFAIIDEAGQLTTPAILGALRFAKRFILVGDEKQLPPLVLSEEAARQGLSESLFSQLKRLDGGYMKGHAGEISACVPLRVQYRMNDDICEFASRMFYDGKLIAHPSVARRQLDVSKRGVKLPGESDAIARALMPLLPMVFLDVRETAAQQEMQVKTSHAEARTVRDIVAGLLARGIAAEDIGIIAPYRAQVANLRRHLFNEDRASEREGLMLDFPLTVDTVDRFQGGERKVIIISFATSRTPDATSQLRDFLTNPNRLNVALTRAQRKLILVGNASALKTLPIFKELLLYCKYRNTLISHSVSALTPIPR